MNIRRAIAELENKIKTERAKKADLITLPKSIEGTNCGNCRLYQCRSQFLYE